MGSVRQFDAVSSVLLGLVEGGIHTVDKRLRGIPLRVDLSHARTDRDLELRVRIQEGSVLYGLPDLVPTYLPDTMTSASISCPWAGGILAKRASGRMHPARRDLRPMANGSFRETEISASNGL